jgi:RNA polymerase sigma-70 factor, ECF subfamily
MAGLYPAEKRFTQHAAETDEQLLERSLRGEPAAFEIIVVRYKDRLFNFVIRFVNDERTAEDVVQDTFLRAFTKRADFRAVAKFSTWIFTIAGNLAKSELRRRKRWRFLRLGTPDDNGYTIELPDNCNRPDRSTETMLADERIQHAMDILPDKYREAVLLRDVEGFDYEEISEITRCPLGTVKSRINRGRLKLQEELADYAAELCVGLG